MLLQIIEVIVLCDENVSWEESEKNVKIKLVHIVSYFL